MPSRSKRSKKLKQLEDKMKIIKKELQRRRKNERVATSEKTSPAKKRRKPTKAPFEECLAILDRMSKLQYCKAFLQPVDWKAMNLPTYPQVIEHPMDMSTVRRKVLGNEYQSPYQFARDMRLIYQNAQTFNKMGTSTYNMSVKFHKKFEEEFERKIVDLHERNEFTHRIAKVMACLMKNADSLAFRLPVDPVLLEIPDYLDVIETPMDLGTIYNRIDSYTQFKRFVADLLLVWDNCCTYNPKGNLIHQQALKLREYSIKQLTRLCHQDFNIWQDDNAMSPTPFPVSSLTMQSSSLADDQMAALQHPAGYHQGPAVTTLAPGPAVTMQSDSDPNGMEEDLGAGSAAPPSAAMSQEPQQPPEEEPEQDIFKLLDTMDDEEEEHKMMIDHLLKKTELGEDTQALSLQQKEELQRGIQCLESDYFDPLISMLQSFIPEGEGDDDEVELDVDSIDDSLQCKMYNYMVRAIRQQEQSRVDALGTAAGAARTLPATNQEPRGTDTAQRAAPRDTNHDDDGDGRDDDGRRGGDGDHSMSGMGTAPQTDDGRNANDMEVDHEESPAMDAAADIGDAAASMAALNDGSGGSGGGGVQPVGVAEEHHDGDGGGNSVGPTVVDAFPTTVPEDAPAAPNRDGHGAEHRLSGGDDDRFEFGSMEEDGRRMEDDGDVEMDGGGGGAAIAAGAGDSGQGQRGDDVLGDIADAVESNVTASTSVPVMESSANTVAENGDSERPQPAASAEVAPQTASDVAAATTSIPTMPDQEELRQRDDHSHHTTDSAQSAVNNDDAETPTAGDGDGQTLTPQKANEGNVEEQALAKGMDVDVGHRLDAMDAVQEQKGLEEENHDDDEDEDVDTPLADEIDF